MLPRQKKKIILSSLISVSVLFATTAFLVNTQKQNNELEKHEKLSLNSVVLQNESFDCFSTQLQNYSSYEIFQQDNLFYKNLLLDNFVQFSNGKYIEKPLLKYNGTKESFITKQKPKIEIEIIEKDQNQKVTLGTQLRFRILYNLNTNTQQYDQQTNWLRLFNLKPKIDWLLETNKFDISQNNKFAFYSAEDFSKNFKQNIIGDGKDDQNSNGLIGYTPTSINKLIKTNIPFELFYDFRPLIQLGTINNEEGAITNNSISIEIPSVNIVNPEWKHNEDIFKKTTLYFDLINFKKIPLNIEFNPNPIIDISQNNVLNKLTAPLFNENTFLKELVNTNTSSFDSNYLISINKDISFFKSLLTSFEISEINEEQGELKLTFKIENDKYNQYNGIYSYKIIGFKKIYNLTSNFKYENINSDIKINKKDFNFLNNTQLESAIKNNEKGNVLNYIKTNVSDFFSHNKEIKGLFQVKDEKFINSYLENTKTEVQIFQNLGQINVKFYLNLDAINDTILYLDNNLLKTKVIELKIFGYASNPYQINLLKEKIEDKDAFRLLEDDFYGNFIQFGETESHFNVIKTNLTKEEFKQISRFNIDKSEKYKIAIVNLWYIENDKEVNKIISINSATSISYPDLSDDVQVFDASRYNEWKEKSVDNFTNDDFISLISFNDIKNKYNLMSISCSRDVFNNVLLEKIESTKYSTSIEFKLKLRTSMNTSKEYRFVVSNLKPKLENYSEILIYVFLGITGTLLLVLIGLLVHRSFIKRKVLKTNKWENDKGEA